MLSSGLGCGRLSRFRKAEVGALRETSESKWNGHDKEIGGMEVGCLPLDAGGMVTMVSPAV